ncbi:MAG: hypothetical protein ACP5GJ_04160 [Nanopusillaceae archaeon]
MDKAKNIITLSIIISILTFFLGILLGYILYQYSFQQSILQINNINSLVISAQYLAQSQKLECTENYFSFLQYLKSQIAQIGLELTYLESPENIYFNKGEVDYLKSQYFNLEYLHFLLTRNYIEECDYTNFTLILYFYNNKVCSTECYNEGDILTYLYTKYYDSLYIYSFDSSYPNYFIRYYDLKYNITTWPFIIMIKNNGTFIFRGFINESTLENYLTS